MLFERANSTYNRDCVSFKLRQAKSAELAASVHSITVAHTSIIHHADEGTAASTAADTGLHRSGAFSVLLHRTNVHQPKIAVHNASGSHLSHALQHHRPKWLYYHNQGETLMIKPA